MPSDFDLVEKNGSNARADHRRLHPCTGVDDAEHGPVAVDQLGADRDAMTRTGCSIPGVDDQVQQDLLQLTDIAQDGNRAFAQLDLEVDVLGDAAAQEGRHLPDDDG